MPWLISVLGAALGLAGAWSLWNGISFIRLDWGQTETVAGTVALSAGIVTLGIGAVLFALRDLRAGSAPVPTTGADTVLDPDSSLVAASGPSGSCTVGCEPLQVEARDRRNAENRAFTAGASCIAARRRCADARAASAPAPEPSPAAIPDIVPAQEIPPMPTDPEAPTVVGRYDANGATYVLFSDGTIEVETVSGTHRFASMADLKDHIERQDEI